MTSQRHQSPGQTEMKRGHLVFRNRNQEDDTEQQQLWLRVLSFLNSRSCHACLHVSHGMLTAAKDAIRARRTDLTDGRGGRPPLPCRNDVDAEPYPDFIFTSQVRLPPGLRNRSLEGQGCTCRSTAAAAARSGDEENGRDEEAFMAETGVCCRDDECPCYVKAKQLNPQGPVTLECHVTCSCSPSSCQLRPSQKGPWPPLLIDKTRDGRGWGLVTLQPLAPGALVCEYVGELLSAEEANRRMEEEYDKQGLNYLLVVREETEAVVLRMHIDATRYGNASRFVNHSCDPNLNLLIVRHNMLLPRLVFYTRKAVEAGSEVTFDYGDGARGGGANRKVCRCGSTCCRGSLPYDPSILPHKAGGRSGAETVAGPSTDGVTKGRSIPGPHAISRFMYV